VALTGEELPAVDRLESLLDDLAGEVGTGAGASAALVLGLAAEVVTRAARAATWSGAGGAAAQGSLLRARAVRLASANATAFERARTLLDAPHVLPARARDWTLGRALEHAADVPLAIAECAADVALLAAETAQHADGVGRADAAAVAAVADGVARAMGLLVEANLTVSADDDRAADARAAAVRAAQAAATARGEG
jgi:formiminotetrahydrofolate cyclodeaminase